MRFSGIKKLLLQPYDENYDSIIYESRIFIQDSLFYWFDYEAEDINDYYERGTMVISQEMYWREV